MIRLVLIALLAAVTFDAQAAPDTCLITGTAYDYSGKPLPNAVIRLIDQQTHQTAYRATDMNAMFSFADQLPDASGQRYRLDVLSPPTVVVGTLLPTRSVLGIAPSFVCEAGQSVRADVKVEVL
jgi:hypothetical protein